MAIERATSGGGSGGTSITDPNDPRLLTLLKQQQLDAGKRWADGTPIQVAKRLKAAADAAKIKHGVQTPRMFFQSAWDAAAKTWDIAVAKDNLNHWQSISTDAQKDYQNAVDAWISNPSGKTYTDWQNAGAALHTNHVNLVKSQQELTAAQNYQGSHPPQTSKPTDGGRSGTSGGQSGAGTGAAAGSFATWGTGTLSKASTTDFGRAYTLTNGSMVVFANNGSQYSLDANQHIVSGTDKNGHALTAAQISALNNPSSGGGSGGGGTGSGSGSGGGFVGGSGAGTGTPPTPVKTRTDWAADYGTQAALVDSVPELKTLFNQAVAGKWSTAKFKAAFNNTDWYKNHNDAWRVAFGVEKTDKGSWNHEMDLAKGYVNNLMVQTGATLTDAQVEKLARQSLYLSGGTHSGIDLTALKTRVVGTGVITGTTGEALTTINALKQHGADMGVDHNDAWYVVAAKNVLHGDGALDDWKGKINNLAKTKYSSYADQIDNGLTVKQIASPYTNSMANILEVSADSLNLNDPTINRALTNVDQTGKQTAVPLWQFETSLRQDPRWATTKNAKDTLDSTAHSILQNFGLAW
jgi:hypothetical protein